jgi:hypothetical protein
MIKDVCSICSDFDYYWYFIIAHIAKISERGITGCFYSLSIFAGDLIPFSQWLQHISVQTLLGINR